MTPERRTEFLDAINYGRRRGWITGPEPRQVEITPEIAARAIQMHHSGRQSRFDIAVRLGITSDQVATIVENPKDFIDKGKGISW